MIPYIQPIFVPDEDRFRQNKESLISFGKYIKKYPYDVKCIFGGWCSNDVWWKEIYAVIEKNIPPDLVFGAMSFDRNYGKAFVVNALFDKIKELEFDFFLSGDSDIIFSIKTNNLFERLSDVAMASPNATKKPFGFIGLQQEINCCHKLTRTNHYYIKNRFNEIETLQQPGHPSGIAGGSLFIGRKFWEKVGGYKVMGVYAGDDAYLIHDAYSSGFSYQLAPHISVIHPPANDAEYDQWKKKKLLDGSYDGKNRSMIELNEDIKDHEKFWKERNS